MKDIIRQVLSVMKHSNHSGWNRRVLAFFLIFTLAFSCLPFQQIAQASAIREAESSDATEREDKSAADTKEESVDEKTKKEESTELSTKAKVKTAENTTDASGDASVDAVFIGDSYAGGYNANQKIFDSEHAWPVYAAEKLNTEHYVCKWYGGTGFARVCDGVNFLSLVTDAANEISDRSAVKYLVICGGYNDFIYDYSTLKAKAAETIAYAKNSFPNATILVGMIGADSGDTSVESKLMTVTRNAYADAAAENGAYYLTNGEYILQNEENVFTNGDSFHPNEKGHQAIAEYIYAVLNGYTIDRDKVKIQYHSNFNDTDTVETQEIDKTDTAAKLSFKDIFQQDFGNATFLGWSKLRNAEIGEYFSYSQISAEWMSQNYPYVNLYAIWAMASRPNFTGVLKIGEQLLCCKDGAYVPNYTGVIFDKDTICRYYVKDGKVDSSYSGLAMDENNNWYYFENGIGNNYYTGLVNHYGGWYYVQEGALNWNFTGLVNHYGGWYYVKKGVVDFSYTGLYQYNGVWYYLQKGCIDWNYNNLVQYNGGWYYVHNGKIDWSYSTLARVNNSGSWYCVKNGKIAWSYTGLASNESGWYYVKKGVVDFSYNGLCQYNGGWYYLQNGKINWSYSNLVKYNGGWYYVHNGKIDWSYSTLARVNNSGSWYCVKNGKIDWNYTGLASNESGWYYVKKGVVDFSFNGLYQYNGSWYYLQNGRVNWDYSNLVQYNGSWYYVRNGKIDWTFTTLSQVNGSGTWYYIRNGVIDWSYSGSYTFQGNKYQIKNGIVVGYAGKAYPTAVFIGDSYATGYSADLPSPDSDHAWPVLTAKLLNCTNYVIKAKGGSGFVNNPDNVNFKTLVSEAANSIKNKNDVDLLVICGGYNDYYYSYAKVKAKAEETIAYAKASFPNARIMVGMIGGHKADTSTEATLLTDTLKAYRDAAKECGVYYLSNAEYVLENAENDVGSDYHHPNTTGQQLLANYISSSVNACYRDSNTINITYYSNDENMNSSYSVQMRKTAQGEKIASTDVFKLDFGNATFLGWSKLRDAVNGDYSSGTTISTAWAKDNYSQVSLYAIWLPNCSDNYTGFIKRTNGMLYYQNGKLASSYTGFASDSSGTQYYVQKGFVYYTYTGLTKVNNSWCYIDKGALNTSANGLVEYNGGYYYLQNGYVNWNYSNLVYHYGSWYYVHNGKIDWSYTTLAQVNGSGKWYYVHNGKIDRSYSGSYRYLGKVYQVKNGVVL